MYNKNGPEVYEKAKSYVFQHTTYFDHQGRPPGRNVINHQQEIYCFSLV